MGIDLMIPFAILIILVIYLIYTRGSHEKDILKLYEEKFEEWKKFNSPIVEDKPKKQFVGMVFNEGYKTSIEVFDKTIEERIKRGKFEVIQIKDNNE